MNVASYSLICFRENSLNSRYTFLAFCRLLKCGGTGLPSSSASLIFWRLLSTADSSSPSAAPRDVHEDPDETETLSMARARGSENEKALFGFGKLRGEGKNFDHYMLSCTAQTAPVHPRARHWNRKIGKRTTIVRTIAMIRSVTGCILLSCTFSAAVRCGASESCCCASDGRSRSIAIGVVRSVHQLTAVFARLPVAARRVLRVRAPCDIKLLPIGGGGDGGGGRW